MLVAGLMGSVVIAVLSFAAAIFASDGCAGDGSFHLGDPGADPSGYCTLTHFPGFSDSPGSLLLVGAIYATPTLVAIIGTALAAASKREAVLRASLLVAGVLGVGLWALLPFANVGYTGVG
jgi:hypothetical protein